MDPISVIETRPGQYSLVLLVGTTDVDEVITELGHEPNGYFWAGMVELLVETEATRLQGRFATDPEAGMYVAYGQDREALDDLAQLLRPVVGDARRLRGLVEFATSSGFEFD
jgi:hypothetical protein